MKYYISEHEIYAVGEGQFTQDEKQALVAAALTEPQLAAANAVIACAPAGAVEMTANDVEAYLTSTVSNEQLAATARAKRDTLLNVFSWRYERYASEIRLEMDTTDAIESLDTYAQALRDITKQEGFPTAIDWPTVPV